MKVAISVPDPIFEAAELLAKQRRIPRSQIFSEALSEYVSKHGSTAVTAKLNDIYSQEDASVDPSLEIAQYASISNETW